MKRYLSVALSTMLALSMLCGTAVETYAAEDETIEAVGLQEARAVNVSTELDSNGYSDEELFSCTNGVVYLKTTYKNEDFTTLSIPPTIGGVDVTTIKATSFRNVKIGKLVIPEGVTAIKNAAFMGSTVQTVVLPSTITTIDANVFCNCTNLSSINLPDGLENIGGSCFSGCSSLTKLDLPDTVTKIGSNAFANCTGLTSITLPKSLTEIASTMFSGCTGIANINVSEENATYSSVDGVVFSKDKKTLVLYPVAHGATYIVPEGTEIIESSVFNNNTQITKVTLPSTLKTIKTSAFEGCSALTSINLPSSLTSIEDSAFKNCSVLVFDGDLPTGLTTLGASSFLGCEKLTSVTIPAGITALSNAVFRNCKALKSVKFHNKVTSIGDEAFYYCESLKDVTLPNSLSYIGGYAFQRCVSLNSITLPDSVTSMGVDVFNSCLSLTEVNIGSGLTTISKDTFAGCIALESITIPDTVTDIEDYAFYKCTSLSSVKLPIGLETMGNYLFSYCENLTELKIPQNVGSINSYAFTNSGLNTVYCYPNTVADNSSLYPTGTVLKYIDIFGEPLKIINATFDLGKWDLKEEDDMNTATTSTSGNKMTLDIQGDGVLYAELAVDSSSSNAGSVLTVTNDGKTVATVKGNGGYTKAASYKLCIPLHSGTNSLVFTYTGSNSDVASVRNVRLADTNDANLDGNVDLSDVSRALAYANGSKSDAFGEATVKGTDTKVTKKAAAGLLRQLAGLE
jgi:hypothetical protein